MPPVTSLSKFRLYVKPLSLALAEKLGTKSLSCSRHPLDLVFVPWRSKAPLLACSGPLASAPRQEHSPISCPARDRSHSRSHSPASCSARDRSPRSIPPRVIPCAEGTPPLLDLARLPRLLHLDRRRRPKPSPLPANRSPPIASPQHEAVRLLLRSTPCSFFPILPISAQKVFVRPEASSRARLHTEGPLPPSLPPAPIPSSSSRTTSPQLASLRRRTEALACSSFPRQTVAHLLHLSFLLFTSASKVKPKPASLIHGICGCLMANFRHNLIQTSW